MRDGPVHNSIKNRLKRKKKVKHLEKKKFTNKTFLNAEYSSNPLSRDKQFFSVRSGIWLLLV